MLLCPTLKSKIFCWFKEVKPFYALTLFLLLYYMLPNVVGCRKVRSSNPQIVAHVQFAGMATLRWLSPEMVSLSLCESFLAPRAVS